MVKNFINYIQWWNLQLTTSNCVLEIFIKRKQTGKLDRKIPNALIRWFLDAPKKENFYSSDGKGINSVLGSMEKWLGLRSRFSVRATILDFQLWIVIGYPKRENSWGCSKHGPARGPLQARRYTNMAAPTCYLQTGKKTREVACADTLINVKYVVNHISIYNKEFW